MPYGTMLLCVKICAPSAFTKLSGYFYLKCQNTIFKQKTVDILKAVSYNKTIEVALGDEHTNMLSCVYCLSTAPDITVKVNA